MTVHARTLLALALSLPALAGCSSDPSPGTDAGVTPGTDAPIAPGTDAPVAPGTDAPIASTSDAGPSADFETPLDTWTYVAIPGGACANGSAYGVAVNRTDRSDRVMIFMQGGGACYDQITCYLLRTATHVSDTLDAGDVVAEAEAMGDYFPAHDDTTSPFASATYVYLPYCTGDAHTGSAVTDHGGTETHHYGGINVAGVAAATQAAFPDADRVWVTGASAGGYGAMVNWYRFRAAFPAARVDVLDDSGPPVDIEAGRWAMMTGAWGVVPPPDCPDCLDGLSHVIDYYMTSVTDGDHYALMQATQDATIRGYTGLTAMELETGVRALADTFAASSAFHVYVVDSNEHVLLDNPARTSAGVVLGDWVADFATDDAAWTNVVPPP